MNKADKEYHDGARDMLNLLLREGRVYGFRLVTSRDPERVLDDANLLLRNLGWGRDVNINRSELSELLANYTLDAREPKQLIGDILPSDFKIE